MFNQWCTIESDPGVFTELISKIGVPDVQVEEVYSLDDKMLIERLNPIYGLIFLFKWTKDPEPRQCLTDQDKDLFFARQIVNNACATQAILAVVLNSPVQVNQPLKTFYEFTKGLPSEDKGITLSNSNEIRLIHNSFSRPEPFIFKEDKKPKKKQDAFHFVSYVPFKGVLYELDGLQKGPISIGKFEDNNWIPVAEAEIQKRISRYEKNEIRFTLLAVCQKLKYKAELHIKELEQKKLQALVQLSKLDDTLPELASLAELKQKYPSATETETTQSKEALLTQLAHLEGDISAEQLSIHDEQLKLEDQKKENARRKHNYIPLILEMLKTAAAKGKLTELLEIYHQKKKEKVQASTTPK